MESVSGARIELTRRATLLSPAGDIARSLSDPPRSILQHTKMGVLHLPEPKVQPTITASFSGTCQPFSPGGHMALGWIIAGKGYYDCIPSQTGNSDDVAEYSALIGLLETVLDSCADPCELRIAGESEQMICEVRIGWSGPNSLHVIHHLHVRATELIAKLTAKGWTIHLHCVGRDENIHAHRASTAALAETGRGRTQVKPNHGYTPIFREMAGALNISSIRFGHVLYALGLCGADKKPTGKAFNEGFAQRRLGGFGVVFDWQKDKAIAAVADCLVDPRYAASIAARQIRASNGMVVASHFCGHKTLVDRRATKDDLAFVAKSLCRSCRAGDKVLFFAERNQVLPLLETGCTLYFAVRIAIADPRLWAGVFRACWSDWARILREEKLESLRGTCERPELDPEFLAYCASSKSPKATDLNELMREARDN